MSGSSGRALQIEHPCPQCGGPVILEETDHFLSCNYCRVNLFILTKNFFRYIFPPKRHPVADTFFVPYWRFRGMYFSFRPYEVKSKVLDASFLSADLKFMPISMGMRTQALKMNFADADMKTHYLTSHTSYRDALTRVEGVTRASDGFYHTGKVYDRAFIGETVSNIYAPVYVKNRALYDGILNRPIGNLTVLRQEKLEDLDHKRNWKIRFISALCPDCGWDMEGDRESVVLICKNCNSAWHSVRGKFQKVRFRVVPGKKKGIIFMPFWKMSVRIEGLELSSYADLVKIANLPRAIQAKWHDEELFFWAPAFKVYPRIFLRLAGRMTYTNYKGKMSDELTGATYFPVTLDSFEAYESVKIILANSVVAKRKIYPLLPDVITIPNSATLIYFPFEVQRTELYQHELKFSIQKSTVRGLKNL